MSRRASAKCAAVLAVVILSTVLVGCMSAKAGQRCRGNGWGGQGQWVLRCERARWVRKATKAEVSALLLAIIRSRTTTSPPSTAPPAGGCPNYRRIEVDSPRNSNPGSPYPVSSSVTSDGRLVAFGGTGERLPFIYEMATGQRRSDFLQDLPTPDGSRWRRLVLSGDGRVAMVGQVFPPSFPEQEEARRTLTWIIDLETLDAWSTPGVPIAMSENGSSGLVRRTPPSQVWVVNEDDPVGWFVGSEVGIPFELLSADGGVVVANRGFASEFSSISGQLRTARLLTPAYWINPAGTTAIGVFGDGREWYEVDVDGSSSSLIPLPVGVQTLGIFSAALVSDDGQRLIRMVQKGSGPQPAFWLWTDRSTGINAAAVFPGRWPPEAAWADLTVVASASGGSIYTCT